MTAPPVSVWTRVSSRFVRVAASLLAIAVGLVALAPPASAHRGDQSYVYLDVGETSLSGRVEFPVLDIRTVFGVDLVPLEGEQFDAAMKGVAPRLQEYAQTIISIGAGGETYPLVFDGVEALSEYPEEPDRNYIILPFTVDKDFTAVPRTLDVTFEPFFDEIQNRDALLLIANDWSAGVFENGEEVLQSFTPGNRTQAVGLDSGAWWKTVKASTRLGVDHIKTGPDHILFILVLLLPSVLLMGTTGWRAAPSFGSALWRIVKIATMFTVAHTITFSLAGLDILPLPPSKFVESIIAISIALAALHNLRPIARNKEWMIAFGFGLFHGMGFASLVEDLEVSRTTQLLSLLGRNIGIELGQVAVILLAFPTLYLLRRTTLYRPVFVGGSVLLAVVSVGWMIERVFEVDLGINGAVEPVLEFPRVVVYVAIITALAFAWFLRERKADRLLDVHQHPAAEVEFVGAS
jgi:hypothetical protein